MAKAHQQSVLTGGEVEETPTLHRFRHTLARILLQRGVPVADVADLLGDDEETVRQHYARWVPERQARLTNILRDAFNDNHAQSWWPSDNGREIPAPCSITPRSAIWCEFAWPHSPGRCMYCSPVSFQAGCG